MASSPKFFLVAPPWLDIYADFKSAAKLGCVSPPLGLIYLAGAVRQAGGQCRIVDMEAEALSLEGLLQLVEQYQPDIVGFTATTPVYNNAKALAREVKARHPERLVGIGGVHSTIMGQQVLQECPFLDFQVLGEAEFTIQDMVRQYAAHRTVEDIPGVLVRRPDGSIDDRAPRPLMHELDEIPLPARDMLPPQHYRHYLPGKGYVSYAGLFTSRGCPYQCIFCSQHTMHGRRMRWHSVDRVLQELETIVRQQSIRHVIFMDETLTLNKKRTIELCQAIERSGLKFTWEGWTHAATIDEELLSAMKRAGLIRLSFGIESGDPEILKSIKKGLTLDQVKKAYRIARKLGIETRGSAILGHPHETRKTAWRTIKFLRDLKDCQQVFLNIACPYPGTEFHQQAINGNGGIRLLTTDYTKYTRYGQPVLAVNDLEPEDLKRLQVLGLLLFYLTPERIWYNVFQRAGLRAGAINGVSFLRGVLNSLLRAKGDQ